jgi:parvulin-like peptidyl-prolyl isomerase
MPFSYYLIEVLMPNTPVQKKFVNKHKARLEREQQQRRIMVISAIVVAALIFIVLIYGVVDQTVLKNNKAVAKVDGETIRSVDFVKQVKFTRLNMIQDALQYEQFAQYFGTDNQFTAYIEQIKSQLTLPEYVGEQVLDNMINNIIVAKYAADNGISVTEAEVDEEIRKQFGFYPNGTPTPENTATPYATSTMNPTQYAIVTATPTANPTAVPEEVAPEEVTPEATEIPTEIPTEAVEATPAFTSTPLPTATPYTEEGFQVAYKGALENMSVTDFTDKDLRDYFRNSLLRQKVSEKITANVATEAEQVWARHILVATEEEANAVILRLENGEEFAMVAAEISLDTSNKDTGGDLSWFGKGVMDTAFEEAAYALSVGETSSAVQSQFGWHIIQLLGKEVRPLTDTQLSQEKQTMFSDWLTTEKEKYTIEKFEQTWKAIVPSEPDYTTYVSSLSQ